MHVLVLGRHGQVARELAGMPLPAGWSLRTAGRAELDLTDLGGLRDRLLSLAPDVVINAAGYTAVDQAEGEPAAAAVLNRDGPAIAAAACAEVGAPFVHISTDYVFDGRKGEPYLEADPVCPVGVYGRTKAEGEAAVTESGAITAILRTSWVYSAHGTNFVKTMVRLAGEREAVSVVDDQVGRPTWARDVAAAALLACAALRDDPSDAGVFHITGEGDATWADVADEVFAVMREAGRSAPVLRRIATAEYPTAAMRPADSRLGGSRAEEVLYFRRRPWRDGVRSVLAELGCA